MNPLLAIGLLIVVAGVFADAFSAKPAAKVVKFTPKEKKEETPKPKKDETPQSKDD
jgi:hypothetical protein